MRFATLIVAMLSAVPAMAEPALIVPDAVEQGALIVGRTDPGATVLIDGAPVRVSASGRFLAAVGRDDVGAREIAAADESGAAVSAAVSIARRDYAIQRIDGLPKKTVTPDPETAERIGREIARIKRVRTVDTAEAPFENGFQWPVTGPVTGVYGSQRILNGNPRRPHFGIDIAAPEGAAISAMTDGWVRLVDADMILTGQTVMIDHGHGLTSIYTHMSDIAVTEGQWIGKGETVGAIGQTGRATGPHLHLGVTLFSVQLDPMLVIGQMPDG